jgi:glutathione S-transferase
MVIVHHLNNSRSQRIIWLLEELGVAYQVKRYERDSKTLLAPPELFKVHPLGKSPVISDGDIVVAESGAIVEYLVNTYGSEAFKPASNSQAQRDYSYWLHFAEGSAMPPLVMKLVFDRIENAPVPFFIKPILKGVSKKVNSEFIMPNINRQLAFIEKHLKENTWFAGQQFSAADIQMSFPMEAAISRIGSVGQFPAILDFVKRIQARPAYQAALKSGGPYAYA